MARHMVVSGGTWAVFLEDDGTYSLYSNTTKASISKLTKGDIKALSGIGTVLK